MKKGFTLVELLFVMLVFTSIIYTTSMGCALNTPVASPQQDIGGGNIAGGSNYITQMTGSATVMVIVSVVFLGMFFLTLKMGYSLHIEKKTNKELRLKNLTYQERTLELFEKVANKS
jgi:prepilin-type N-terminal cleavage/methylation domain-containing protein